MEKLIHISAGRGPLECAWVVKKVLGVVQREALRLNLTTQVVERKPVNHPSGLSSATLILSGKLAGEFVKDWEGSLLWIGKSQFRPQHKRKNWFVELCELDPPSQFDLDLEDVHFQATKSSGPGGQHVNKTMSAIRAIHKPTGISVFVQESRSQHQNKIVAIQRLSEEMKRKNNLLLQNFESEHWKKKIIVQRGNPKRIFEGCDFVPKN